MPFQKGSAGLEDDPATWIPVVKSLTGIDLATVADPQAACEAQGGTYVPADATQSSNAAFNSGLIEHTAAPLEAEVASVTAARDALQGLLDAARAEIARLATGTASLRVALPSARLSAATATRRGIRVALTGAPGTAAKAHLTIGERRARKLKVRSSVLASAKATFGADGKAAVTLKPGPNAGRRLRALDRAIADHRARPRRRPDRHRERLAHPLTTREEPTMTTHRTTTLAIAAAATLALAAPALAHTEVESTSPAAGGKASTSITKVTVTFGEAIRTGTLKVYGPGGGKVSKGSGGRDPRKITRVKARAEGLARGRPLHGEVARDRRRRPPPARLLPLQAALAGWTVAGSPSPCSPRPRRARPRPRRRPPTSRSRRPRSRPATP